MKERGHLGDLGLDRRIILKWIFRKWDLGVWTRSSWFRIRKGGSIIYIIPIFATLITTRTTLWMVYELTIISTPHGIS
jgi:hypothetical protein